MASTLDERFKLFMASFPGVEIIDDILADNSFPGKQRADYLFQNRKIVIELKSLQTDTSPKVDKELNTHRNRDDFPDIYGNVDLQKILKHLPDGDAINHKIYRNVTRSIDEAVRHAEHQIIDTKEILGLPGSAGCLVILNEKIEILDPKVVVRRVSELLCSRKNRGNATSPIDIVWLLFESHITKLSGSLSGDLDVLLDGTNPIQAQCCANYLDMLREGGAKLNGQPLHRLAGITRIDEIHFKPIPKRRDSPNKLKRYEVEQGQYDVMPYLRDFSEEELRRHGATVFLHLKPFLTDGCVLSSAQSENDFKALKLAWNHFLRESNHRGLNLKYLKQVEM